MDNDRRNPDMLLHKIEQEEEKKARGKLKIFFGYAAGIGKTYAMLSYAKKELRSGVDLVIGYIEPHNRPETKKKVKGIEQVPLKVYQVQNLTCYEPDIDAILKRNPSVVLLDEMAHSNAGGSRHTKRYQDIEEVLKAGIDVYTTLNVQHIESVQDVIAEITGVTVRECIPDTMFDRAYEIEMVDLPPQELLERLQQGKVYQTEKISQALTHFFTLENLTALREIALRRMADWVNKEQDSFLTGNSKANASEHIMMCLSASPSNPKVIRQAAKMAKAFHGQFTAFYVERPDATSMSTEDEIRLRRNRKLAEKFGANVVISYGNDIVEQIAEYAKLARVTKLVLGRSYTKKEHFSVHKSFVDQLTRLLPNIEIFMIPDVVSEEFIPKRKQYPYRIQWENLNKIKICMVNVAICTVIALAFRGLHFSEANIIMVYMLGVAVTALLVNTFFEGILNGVLSILVFNFFFTSPQYTLDVNDPGHIVTFIVMFITSSIISHLLKKVKMAAKQNAQKAYRTEILLQSSRIFQQKRGSEEIGKATLEQLEKLLSRDVFLFLGNPKNDQVLFVKKESGSPFLLSAQEKAVADWCYKNNKCAGATTSTLPGAKNLYLTVRNENQVFGVVGIMLEGGAIPEFEESILFAILNESALAFTTEQVIEKEKELAIKLEQERLRANLLRTISHDLRTPLTSILGNADVLQSESKHLSEESKERIYKDIYEDSVWLIDLVENLLSVTRIENGSMALNLQLEVVDELIVEALKYGRKHVVNHEICYTSSEKEYLVEVDGKLMIQVLHNLLMNAVKYTPPNTRIEVLVEHKGTEVIIRVRDHGDGITNEEKERIFTMFYSSTQRVADGRRGMGLGLALCKTIVDAHHGEIWVEDTKPGGGATFAIRIKGKESGELC